MIDYITCSQCGTVHKEASGMLDPENAIAVFPTEPTPFIENEKTFEEKVKQPVPAKDNNNSQNQEND
jgi:hypothetical protein